MGGSNYDSAGRFKDSIRSGPKVFRRPATADRAPTGAAFLPAAIRFKPGVDLFSPGVGFGEGIGKGGHCGPPVMGVGGPGLWG